MPTCYLLLGGSRTGGAAVGGVLDAIGVRMALPGGSGMPSEANPNGFFNDNDFEGFCNGVFGSYFPQEKRDLTDANIGLLSRFIQQRAVGKWGVKEWRVAMFLPHFIALTGDCKIIRTIRHPIQRSVDSWNKHFSRLETCTVDDYQRCLGFIDASLAEARLPTLQLDYDDIYDRSKETVEALARFVGTEPNEQALSVIDERLRRF